MSCDKSKIFTLDINTKTELVRYLETEEEEERYSLPCGGIIGYVYSHGTIELLNNAYNHKLYNSQIDINTYMPVICMPINNLKE